MHLKKFSFSYCCGNFFEIESERLPTKHVAISEIESDIHISYKLYKSCDCSRSNQEIYHVMWVIIISVHYLQSYTQIIYIALFNVFRSQTTVCIYFLDLINWSNWLHKILIYIDDLIHWYLASGNKEHWQSIKII